MTYQDSPSGPRSFAQEAEYSPASSARAHAVGSRRLRLLYFGAASIWGFVIGVAGILAGQGLSGAAAAPTLPGILALVPAAGIALAGAGVIAGSYQEAKRRRR